MTSPGPPLLSPLLPLCHLKTIGGGSAESEKTSQCTLRKAEQEKTESLEGVFFYFTDVILAINDIPNGASPGPDGVPPCMLKKYKINISRMLILIWQESYES